MPPYFVDLPAGPWLPPALDRAADAAAARLEAAFTAVSAGGSMLSSSWGAMAPYSPALENQVRAPAAAPLTPRPRPARSTTLTRSPPPSASPPPPPLSPQAMWFLSPRTQLLETPLILALVLPLAALLARGRWPVAVAPLPSAGELKARGAGPALQALFARSRRAGSAWAALLAAADAALTAGAWLFAALTVYYKLQVNEANAAGEPDGRTRAAYLLQASRPPAAAAPPGARPRRSTTYRRPRRPLF